ncbi:MAG: ATP phosphoribosyltransferase regulatory subunit [Nitrospirae bacterium]|nr:ATP phosphoribosyltransferase regulatory subunit [Nitrospirota bacterium]
MKKIMQESIIKIPRGTATHLPEVASLRRYTQEALLSTFFDWGYKEVVTPVFEYLDVLSAGLTSGLNEKSYKFIDRETGKIMLLRPDITPQVARMAAGILSNEPKPLRLCYYGNIFRYEEAHAGREQEIFQVGCELAGSASPEADAEMIALASESLMRLRIEDFKIVVGNVNYLYGIISSLNNSPGISISQENEHSLKDAITKKDAGELENILNKIGLSIETKRNLIQLPDLFGGDEIFNKAADISANQVSYDAINNLKEIYSTLCYYGLKDKIIFDLCDIREIDYYTGLFFEIFSPGIPYPIGRGGRYDNLIGKFGCESPSTGFAIDIESIIRLIELNSREKYINNNVKYLITGEGKETAEAINMVRGLRIKGYSAILDTGLADIDSSISYAAKNNIEKIIYIEGKNKKQFFIIDVKTGKKTKTERNKLYPR